MHSSLVEMRKIWDMYLKAVKVLVNTVLTTQSDALCEPSRTSSIWIKDSKRNCTRRWRIRIIGCVANEEFASVDIWAPRFPVELRIRHWTSIP